MNWRKKLPNISHVNGIRPMILYPALIMVLFHCYLCDLRKSIYDRFPDSSEKLNPKPHMKSILGKNTSGYSHVAIKPIIFPAEAKHSATLIFLHDFVEFNDSYIHDMKKLRLPYMKIICASDNIKPMTVGNEIHFASSYAFVEKKVLPENIRGVNFVHDLIRKEMKKGIPPHRIILGGMAQGAPMALHAALAFPRQLGAFICLSAYRPYKESLLPRINLANKDIPIFHGHIQGNGVVDDEEFEPFAMDLKNHISVDFMFNLYRGIDPTINQELDDMREFCKERVPQFDTRTMTTTIPRLSNLKKTRTNK